MSEFLQHQAVRSRTHRRHRVRRWLRFVERHLRMVCIWGFGMTLLYGIYAAALVHRTLAVEHVVVRGNLRVLTEAAVRDLAGVAIGDHLLRVPLATVQARLRRSPWIREVGVRRKLPNAVWLYIEERQAAALLNMGGTMHLIDRDGLVFKPAAPEELTDLPVISGVTDLAFDHAQMGYSRQIAQMLQVMRTCERHALAEYFGCSEIVRDRYGRISLVTEQPAMQLRLGASPSEEQFDRLLTIVSTVQTAERPISSIDLFMERKVVVRHAS